MLFKNINPKNSFRHIKSISVFIGANLFFLANFLPEFISEDLPKDLAEEKNKDLKEFKKVQA